MIEDDWLTRDLLPAKPVQALRHVSYDMTLARPIELADGSSITALEAQWELYDRARKFAEEHGLDCIGGEDVGSEVLAPLGGGPHRPGDRPDDARRPGRLDRQAPAASTATASATASGWDDARLAAMDLQYHDLRPEKSLAARVGLERIAVRRGGRPAAMTEPPPDTRAYFRGRCLQRWPDEHRGRQLGLAGVRRRWRSAPPCAHDGTATWNRGARG